METFTPLASTLGGVLIGLSASWLLLVHGRIAGISGIAFGLLTERRADELGWRAAFLLGLLAAGVGGYLLAPAAFVYAPDPGRPLGVVGLAGVVVGLGVRFGGGCTSGHGVCGLTRLSARSFVAVVTFMLTGGLTVLAYRLLAGGAS